MKYKLLVLDVDGTLLDSEKKISKRTLAALLKVQQMGVRIVLASGRPTYGLMPIAKTLELGNYGGFILSYNGGQIINAQSGELLFERRINPEMLPYLEKKSRKNGFAIFTYHEDTIITDSPENEHIRREAELNGLKIIAETEFSIAVDFAPCKCMLVSDDEEALVGLEDHWRRRLNGALDVFRSEPYFLEVVPCSIDKSNTLGALLEKLGIKSEEVIAIGDGVCDVSMIQSAGLGAFAAVLMLIFKDTILGFVAGVLLSENDMVHIGDWIEMPQNNVNGVVMDITLNIVKVQNFDNTIVTIPPYSLVSGSFINWRGMTESGGRRIMREYALKLDYIQPCTPEFLEKMKKFDADLADFITEKQKQAAEGKVANTDNPAGLVNGTIDTNVGLLRAYMTLYLKRHPFISKDLLLMVRTLAPTENGLPVQIYCFSSNKNWPSYESIQAEIMEHFVSVLPEFGLYPFQNPTARDYVISGLIESGKDLSTVDGIPWHSVLPKEEKV